MASASDDAASDLLVQRIALGSGEARREIAVRVRSGDGPPIVWLGGFRSDMRATKALALDAWAAEQGRALIRFDYTGHGESGGRFETATISTWLEDAADVIDRYAGTPPILVGSSMGGWIACLVARQRVADGKSAPAGMTLLAPAIDFTEALLWQALSPDIRATLEREGVWYLPTDYDPEPAPITMRLIEDGRRHVLLNKNFDPGCPVHILQGMNDPDVPYAHALRTIASLPPTGTLLTLIADGDHRLSRPQDITLLLRTVAAFG